MTTKSHKFLMSYLYLTPSERSQHNSTVVTAWWSIAVCEKVDDIHPRPFCQFTSVADGRCCSMNYTLHQHNVTTKYRYLTKQVNSPVLLWAINFSIKWTPEFTILQYVITDHYHWTQWFFSIFIKILWQTLLLHIQGGPKKRTIFECW